MRVLKITLIMILGFSFGGFAQNFSGMYEPVDLYEGLDKSFYSESNFGIKNPVYGAYPITGMIRHNRVDGLYFGYQEDKMSWGNSNFLGLDNIDVHGMLGYSTAQKSFQYSLGAEKSIGYSIKWLLIGGELHNATSTNDYWRTGMYENSLSSFVTGFDFFDYYHTEGYGFYSLIKPFRNVEMGVSYNVDTYSSLSMNTDYSLISRYSNFRFNPAIDSNTDEINQQSVNLGLTLNTKSVNNLSRFWTTISGQAEIADLGSTNNEFLYNRYQVELKSYVRLDKSSLIKWRLMAGSITGNAPDFKHFALGGIGSMRALGFKSMAGNEMILSNLEIELGKKAYGNKTWPDLSSLYFSIFLDSGTSAYNPALFTSKNVLEEYSMNIDRLSHNAGIGVGLGLLRFEIAKPIAGAEGQTSFWIRFNPTF